jgi:2-oxoisovalerate dehydrogenase E1 component alpha subunit
VAEIDPERGRYYAVPQGDWLAGGNPMMAAIDITGTPKRFIDPSAAVVATLPDFAKDVTELITLYRAMVLTRTFDAKAISLQRTGRLGTYASSLGQEAVGVGLAAAMRPDDVLLPSFREHGAQIYRGVTLKELFLYWGGDERGNDFAGPREDFPNCVPVGSHAPHAVGVALAFRLRSEKRAAVCVFGDGATSKGDVAEALNMAGVWKVPAVFVVNNNGWAISIPVARQTAAPTLAQKASASGIAGVRVDGNDVIAVRHAVAAALASARRGNGPSLIEAVTYRLSDHTTADDASRYRDDAEVSRHWPDEPVARLRNYLVNVGAWGREKEDALLHEYGQQVEQAAADFLSTSPLPFAAIFEHAYASMPVDLAEQRDEAANRAGSAP